MKKISLLFCLLTFCVSLCLGATDDSRQKLMESVERINSTLPLDMGDFGSGDKIVYDTLQNQVKIYYTVSPMIVDIKAVKQSGDKSFEEGFRNGVLDDEAKQMIPFLLEADSELGFIISNPDSDQTLYIRFTVPQLEEAIADSMAEDQLYPRLIRRFVAETKSKCPKQMKYGVEMTDVYEKNDYVIYEISVDEDLFPISSFKSSKKEMRDLIEINLFNDPAMVEFVKMVASVGRGLIYNYIGKTSGERVPFIFNNGELQNLIEEHSRGGIAR